MSKLLGGLFSRPSGKASGLVFGAGRTRNGKRVTAREYVIPSDPRTTAQQQQRGKMPFSTAIIQDIGRVIYQNDWNRAVKDLPGFQSLSNRFMTVIDSEGNFTEAPRNTSLGVLHTPVTRSASLAGATVTITFSDELGDLGSATDQVRGFAFDSNAPSEGVQRPVAISVDPDDTREDGTLTITLPEAPVGDVIACFWLYSDEVGIPASHRRSEAVFLLASE